MFKLRRAVVAPPFLIARPTIEENEEETEDEKADAAPDDDEGKAQERIA